MIPIQKVQEIISKYEELEKELSSGKINSKLLQKKLLKKNILIRDCSSFCGLNENYVRIAVKNRNQNKLLIKALGEII